MATKKQKEEKWYILFDNYNSYSDENMQAIKEDWKECNDCEPTEDELYNYIGDIEYEDWCTMKRVLQDTEECNRWIVQGSVGTWQGKREAMKIFNSAESMLEGITQHCDYVKVEYSTKGGLRITATHHDGTNCFDCKLLNSNGWEQYNKWLWGVYNEYQILNKLWDSNFYTRLPRIKW